MKDKFKEFSILIIWILASLYTLFIGIFSNIDLDEKHYANFALVGFTIIFYLYKKVFGHLMIFTLLVVGMLTQSSLSLSHILFGTDFYQISILYLPLIILFISLNFKNLIIWYDEVFN